jgi:D-serine deaminase-like pyridoxal phosphate-dependent protein
LLTVNEAAKKAMSLLKVGDRPSWVLSVGSTPTAHAASKAEVREKLKTTLVGELEIHAGALNDLVDVIYSSRENAH